MARAMARSSRQQRARAAARQRGAIFVESAIVASMLMTMLAGALFFHNLYRTKIQATREARLSAWQEAEAGCPSNFGIGQLFNLISINSCLDESCSVGGLNVNNDTSPNWLANGSKVGNVTHSVTAHARAGGRTHSVRAINRVVCNESRQNTRGDLASIGDYILDAVIQQ